MTEGLHDLMLSIGFPQKNKPFFFRSHFTYHHVLLYQMEIHLNHNKLFMFNFILKYAN